MRYNRKDITTVAAPALIAHGVNCSNAMGSGVAKALYTKWPIVKDRYHDVYAGFVAHGDAYDLLGNADFVEVEDGLIVANCFTQETYGRAPNYRYASPHAIKESLTLAAYKACDIGLDKVYVPRIGSGLGGLDWEKDVVPVLLEIEKYISLTFVVCDI